MRRREKEKKQREAASIAKEEGCDDDEVEVEVDGMVVERERADGVVVAVVEEGGDTAAGRERERSECPAEERSKLPCRP